jgi:hypothetical protein
MAPWDGVMGASNQENAWLQSSTLQVKANLTKPNHLLVPGMFATVMLALPPKGLSAAVR